MMTGASEGSSKNCELRKDAVSRPVDKDQTASRRAHRHFDLVVFLGGSVILGHVDGTATRVAYVATTVATAFYT